MTASQLRGTDAWNPAVRRVRDEACDPALEPQAASPRTTADARIALATEGKDVLTMPKTTDKVSEAAATVKPYIDRAREDAELREAVRSAYVSARAIYDELVGNRGVTGAARRVATDREMQDEMRSVVAELRTAADRVRGKQERKRHTGLLVFGLLLAALFNPITGPSLRTWISERVFGETDGFTYQAGSGSGNGSTS